MALSAEEEMLISIIEFNQRKIEELLISRSQAYQVQNKVLLSSPTSCKVVSNGNCQYGERPSTPSEGKTIPQILISQFNDSEKSSPVVVESNKCDKNVENGRSSDDVEKTENIIVDHSIPLPEASIIIDHSVTPPEDCSETEKSNACNHSPIPKTLPPTASINIPGLGPSDISSNPEVQVSEKGKSDSVQHNIIPVNDNDMKNDISKVSKKSQNVWIINCNGKRRKKAQSSSTVDDMKCKAQPPPKRKRCNSSSSISTIPEVTCLKPLVMFNFKSVLDDKKSQNCDAQPIPEESQSQSTVVKQKNQSILVTLDHNQSKRKELATSSDSTLQTKRKTRILSSPLKRNKIDGSPKLKKCIIPRFSNISSNSLEPYVACWAHCPAISARQPQAHCVPKHQFMDHLKTYHNPPRSINLLDQQIVCICHACETVVSYDYLSKSEHLERRCTRWRKQFFLFIENAQDTFAIPRFNAPVVKSPGLAGMFKSVAHHPHLDTLPWKNVKNEHFCYHFCSFCNTFVGDTMRAVSDHTSTALHRVNFRKSGHQVKYNS